THREVGNGGAALSFWPLRLGVRLPEGFPKSREPKMLSADLSAPGALHAWGREAVASRAWAVQWRLALLLIVNLTIVAATFVAENGLLPWYARMDQATAGWCFVVAQAA